MSLAQALRWLAGAWWVLLGTTGQAAERIVSLAPSLTEIVMELGASPRLVGVLDAGPRTPALQALPSVGRYGQLDIERLLALQPDLVLLWPGSVSTAQLDQLQHLNLPVFIAEPHSLSQLADQLQAIAIRIGVHDKGLEVAGRFRQRLAELQTRYRRAEPLRVFYQVWDKPLYTLGGGQIISDAISVCGGSNVFAEQTLPAPQVSVESVLLKDPQVILVPDEAQRQAWQQWAQVTAVKQGRVLLNDPALERPSGQMIEAVGRLCERMASG